MAKNEPTNGYISGISISSSAAAGQVLTAISSVSAGWSAITPRFVVTADLANGPNYWYQSSAGTSSLSMQANPGALLKISANNSGGTANIAGYAIKSNNANMPAGSYKNLSGSIHLATSSVSSGNGSSYFKWYTNASVGNLN